MPRFQNPIIPGFHPDPSICRKGDDYYLVNSSFEFFPGVPLFHSQDLINWEQIGHVLTRESQLSLRGSPTSGGIFAPTIREHNGRFYMITTNILLFPTGHPNFIVHTDDIHGEWSEPVFINHVGIDPSLFWDDDGSAYYVGTGEDGSGSQGIICFGIDPDTGEITTQKHILWYGSGGRCPEGPHLYKIGNYYYLMIAEGGTEYGHMETLARSENLFGPYEGCPNNPILSHRNYDRSPLQAMGHADLVDTPAGDWYLVFHGVRPSGSQLHHIGRETMLAPVTWEDGWIIVNGGQPVGLSMRTPGEGEPARFTSAFREEFSSSPLPPRFSYLRNPVPSNYKVKDGLTLTGGDPLSSRGDVTFLGVRQTQMNLTAQTEVSLSGKGEAGLSVYHTEENHYELLVSKKEGGLSVQLRRQAADLVSLSDPVFFPGASSLTLEVSAESFKYRFFAGESENDLSEIGAGSTQLLSTETMRGTFTGCFFALFAQGDVEARFPYFTVTESDSQRELNDSAPKPLYPV